MSKSIFYVVSFLATGILLLTPFLLTEKPMVSMSLLQVTIFVVVVILLTRNFFFLVLNPWYDVYTYFRDRKYRSRKYRPLVSAIVPAWNEEVGIQLTLESIWASTYKDVEIIVVDDGSTDCTASIVRRFIREKKKKTKHQKIRKTIRLIQQSNQGKGSALNRGIKDSSGEIIITFDADSEVSPTAISAFVKRFRDPQISAAMGQVRIGNRQTLAGLVQSLEYMLTFSFKKTSSLLNVMYVVGGAAAAYRRNIFSDVGYFDTETITEDIDLSLRVLTHRKVISYVENAVVYTEGASSFVSLIKQRLRWRRGRHDALLRHRKLLAKKEGAPHLLLRVVLSASIFLEALLLFEPLFFALLIFYSIAEQNFDSFAVLVVLLAFGFIITLLFSNYRTKYTSFILLSPIVWAGFYLAVLVEYAALAFSLYSLFTGKKVKWQKWDRRGVRGASSPILQAGKKKALVRKYVSICFFIFLLLFAVGIFYYNTYTHTLLLSPILLVLLFAASTDGVFLSLHLTRKKINYPELSFDPKNYPSLSLATTVLKLFLRPLNKL
ncbi:MAG TPA: glycosyltransferase [Candidatus Paceibacterota bacterium]|nr:glycosyltransferase [Candidatus Paceibacterota bacterium]